MDSQSNKLHYMSGYSDNNNIINIINYKQVSNRFKVINHDMTIFQSKMSTYFILTSKKSEQPYIILPIIWNTCKVVPRRKSITNYETNDFCHTHNIRKPASTRSSALYCDCGAVNDKKRLRFLQSIEKRETD